MVKSLLRSFSVSLVAILAFAAFTSAQTGPATIAANSNDGAAKTVTAAAVNNAFLTPTSPSTFENVKIGNFGQVDENYYRGEQPEPDDYKSLADLGIKTIIDLRNDPTDYEKTNAEAVGIKYINIPLSGWKKPKDADIAQFLKVVNDPENGKLFVHCKGGMHRAGMTTAIYRITKYGWDFDTAYKEMKNYHYFSGLVHGALKSYVRDYAKKFEASKARKANAEKTEAMAVSAGQDN